MFKEDNYDIDNFELIPLTNSLRLTFDFNYFFIIANYSLKSMHMFYMFCYCFLWSRDR